MTHQQPEKLRVCVDAFKTPPLPVSRLNVPASSSTWVIFPVQNHFGSNLDINILH